jgi:hypothetical protein
MWSDMTSDRCGSASHHFGHTQSAFSALSSMDIGQCLITLVIGTPLENEKWTETKVMTVTAMLEA